MVSSRQIGLWAIPLVLLSTALTVPAALSADEIADIEPKRYAFLVAVTSYQHAEMNKPRLEFPEADAQAVGKFLEDYGYDVEYLLGRQATKSAIEMKLDELADKGNEEGTVVLGFWGHGVEFEGTSESMFCPFDTKIRTVVDSKGKKLFDKEGKPMVEPDSNSLVGMSTVLQGLRVSGAGNRLLLADCCRQSPNRARGRAFGSKTKLTDLPDNTAALFACSELEQAFEDKEWGHGAFTKCLLDLLPALATGDGDDVNSITGKLKRNVARLVRERSNGRDTQTVNPIFQGAPELKLASKAVVYVPPGMDLDEVTDLAVEFTVTIPASVLETRTRTVNRDGILVEETYTIMVPAMDSRAVTVPAGKTARMILAAKFPAHKIMPTPPFPTPAGTDEPAPPAPSF